MSRVRVDGKFFAVGDERFAFRGVTYGTFAPARGRRAVPGAPADRRGHRRDARGRLHGRAHLHAAARRPDRRSPRATGCGSSPASSTRTGATCSARSRREQRDGRARGARRGPRARRGASPATSGSWRCRSATRCPPTSCAGTARAWSPTRCASSPTIVREEDPDQLVTYANYPTAEYLPLETPRLPHVQRLPRAPRGLPPLPDPLHHLAGDRPLVLGEVGLDAGDRRGRRAAPGGGARLAARDGDRARRRRHLRLLVDRRVVGRRHPVDGWQLRADPRGPLAAPGARGRVALEPRARSATSTSDWPSISVVDLRVQRRATTLDECLRHTCALDYPDLEIDRRRRRLDRRHRGDRRAATRAPASLLDRARRPRRPRATRGSRRPAATSSPTSTPTPTRRPSGRTTWRSASTRPTSAASAVRTCRPPTIRSAPTWSRARPAGPVHVLTSDDRAEHVPGCNMAFWKIVLERGRRLRPGLHVPPATTSTSAGRSLDRELEDRVPPGGARLAPPPAGPARLPAPAARLRAQRGARRGPPPRPLHAGRHGALARAASTTRYAPSLADAADLPRRLRRRRLPVRLPRRRARCSTCCTRSGSRSPSMLLLTAPLGAALALARAARARRPRWRSLALGVVDMVRAEPPRRLRRGRLAVPRPGRRAPPAPAARPLLGASRHRHLAPRAASSRSAACPRAVRELPGGIVVVPEDRPRSELAASLVDALRHAGVRVLASRAAGRTATRALLLSWLRARRAADQQPSRRATSRSATAAAPRRRALLAIVLGAGRDRRWRSLVSPLFALLLVPAAASVARGAVRARRRCPRELPRGCARTA